MSIRIMTAVWNDAPYEGGTLLALLALSDWADDQGRCWPSISSLARKSRQSKSNTKNCLARLRRDGVLIVEQRGNPRRSNHYRIDLDVLRQLPAGPTLTPGQKMAMPIGDRQMAKKRAQGGPMLGPNTSIMEEPSRNQSTSSAKSAIPFYSQADLDGAVQQVWTYYVTVLGKNLKLCKFTDERKRKGLARLKDSLEIAKEGSLENAVGLMKTAVDELARSSFHNGDNERSKVYTDWSDHLFRNRKKLEQWLEQSMYRGRAELKNA